jgi:3-oxoacyl-[acyl-carrier protein] reductase
MAAATGQRVAVVTGGGRGIGAATARRLAADGLAVALVDLDVDAASAVASELVAAGGSALAVSANVADEEQVESAVAEVAAALGPPVVLVNNAGVTRDNLLFKMSASDWDTVIAVHLRGAFLMSKAAQRHMTEAGWGRIVNISSTVALGNRGQANYATAKAGVQGFTKTLAIELGPFGVTVNSIAPGFVATEMTAETARRLGVGVEEFQKRVADQTAVRRVGQPEDIAAAVSFFVRDESSYVSGQVLYVAGGPKA